MAESYSLVLSFEGLGFGFALGGKVLLDLDKNILGMVIVNRWVRVCSCVWNWVVETRFRWWWHQWRSVMVASVEGVRTEDRWREKWIKR